ncbi:hypothetical protein D8S78_17865 [Natrialba swarupiae]|nr:hypothetical protein [Natrialba swarupiae]
MDGTPLAWIKVVPSRGPSGLVSTYQGGPNSTAPRSRRPPSETDAVPTFRWARPTEVHRESETSASERTGFAGRWERLWQRIDNGFS